jgi:monothiol glutaredoxin
MSVLGKIQQQIKENHILLYMKGTPQSPQCGFSARVVEALSKAEKTFATVDILANPDVRKELPKLTHCETFPQMFIDGKWIGGYKEIFSIIKMNF